MVGAQAIASDLLVQKDHQHQQRETLVRPLLACLSLSWHTVAFFLRAQEVEV